MSKWNVDFKKFKVICQRCGKTGEIDYFEPSGFVGLVTKHKHGYIEYFLCLECFEKLYRQVDDALFDIFTALDININFVPGYISVNGSNTVRDLVEVVCEHYRLSDGEKAKVYWVVGRKFNLNEKLEKFGFK